MGESLLGPVDGMFEYTLKDAVNVGIMSCGGPVYRRVRNSNLQLVGGKHIRLPGISRILLVVTRVNNLYKIHTTIILLVFTNAMIMPT